MGSDCRAGDLQRSSAGSNPRGPLYSVVATAGFRHGVLRCSSGGAWQSGTAAGLRWHQRRGASSPSSAAPTRTGVSVRTAGSVALGHTCRSVFVWPEHHRAASAAHVLQRRSTQSIQCSSKHGWRRQHAPFPAACCGAVPTLPATGEHSPGDDQYLRMWALRWAHECPPTWCTIGTSGVAGVAAASDRPAGACAGPCLSRHSLLARGNPHWRHETLTDPSHRSWQYDRRAHASHYRGSDSAGHEGRHEDDLQGSRR